MILLLGAAALAVAGAASVTQPEAFNDITWAYVDYNSSIPMPLVASSRRGPQEILS